MGLRDDDMAGNETNYGMTTPPTNPEATGMTEIIQQLEAGDCRKWQDQLEVAAILRALSRDLAAARAELNQYRLSPQLGCSVDAEVWHQLRMKMDAALGPDFDPYVRGECFAALDAIIGQRDEAMRLLRRVLSQIDLHDGLPELTDETPLIHALLRKVGM